MFYSSCSVKFLTGNYYLSEADIFIHDYLIYSRLLRLISLSQRTVKLLFSLAQNPNVLSMGNQTWFFSCPDLVLLLNILRIAWVSCRSRAQHTGRRQVRNSEIIKQFNRKHYLPFDNVFIDFVFLTTDSNFYCEIAYSNLFF